MPKTNIATQQPVGPYPAGGSVSAGALKINFTAADVSNSNEFIFTGKEILLVTNSGMSPYTVTFTSAPDEHGRTEDVTAYSVPAGETHAFSFRQGSAGWLQSDGHVYFSGSNAALLFAIIAPAN